MNSSKKLTGFVFITLLITPGKICAHELISRYAVIHYEQPELLKQFNSDISLGALSHLMRYKRTITWEDEVANKVDVIVERVLAVLDMHPAKIAFTIVLLPSVSDVQLAYRRKYNINVDFIAFYAPKDKTAFFSVKNLHIGIVAHELAHMVIDQYYGTATPTKIHELLAQFVETHLTDK